MISVTVSHTLSLWTEQQGFLCHNTSLLICEPGKCMDLCLVQLITLALSHLFPFFFLSISFPFCSYILHNVSWDLNITLWCCLYPRSGAALDVSMFPLLSLGALLIRSDFLALSLWASPVCQAAFSLCSAIQDFLPCFLNTHTDTHLLK